MGASERVRLTRNANYWQAGKPYLDEVVALIVKDQSALVAQLESGAIQLADNPLFRGPPERLKTDPQVPGSPESGEPLLLPDCHEPHPHPPLDNRARPPGAELRYGPQADQFASGMASLAQAEALPWVAGSPASTRLRTQTPTLDPDKAESAPGASPASRNLDTEEGCLLAPLYPEYTTFSQSTRLSLATIGVNLRLNSVSCPRLCGLPLTKRTLQLGLAPDGHGILADVALLADGHVTFRAKKRTRPR